MLLLFYKNRVRVLCAFLTQFPKYGFGKNMYECGPKSNMGRLKTEMLFKCGIFGIVILFYVL